MTLADLIALLRDAAGSSAEITIFESDEPLPPCHLHNETPRPPGDVGVHWAGGVLDVCVGCVPEAVTQAVTECGDARTEPRLHLEVTVPTQHLRGAA